MSNFKILIAGKSFFKASNFCVFVPVAKIVPSNERNFFTRAFPIPPVAPVINIFFSFKINHLF